MFMCSCRIDRPGHCSDYAIAEGDRAACAATGIPAAAQAALGEALLARGYLAVSSGTITDERVRQYIEEEEGEQIVDDSRFPIDSS